MVNIFRPRVEADGRERGTQKQYEEHVRIHIVPRIGRFKLAKPTHEVVANFRDQLLRDLSRPTARKVLTNFKSLLKAAKFAHIAADVSIGRVSRERRIERDATFPRPAKSSA